jgi:hypothetical protein
MVDVNSTVGPCTICGKSHKRSEVDKWYYYDGILVCSHHHGVKEWYSDLLIKEAKNNE